MTAITTIQATQVLWDKTADKLYVWDDASGAWELFFVAADLVTNDALTDDLALKVNIAGDTMTGALEAPGIGINTAPDGTNKLSVKSNAALLAALETGSGGTGDIRTVLSKQAAGNTASFLFQNDFSGRAEVGLTGDDDFHFKVSPDGSTFYDGIVLDKTNGQVSLLTPPKITGMTAGSVPFFGSSGLLSQANASLFWDASNARLGVGTASPNYKLHIYDTGSFPRIYVQGDTTRAPGMQLGFDATGSRVALMRALEEDTNGTQLQFYTRSDASVLTLRMSIHDDGKVEILNYASVPYIGINATPDSTNKLSVSSSAILFNNIGAGIQIKLNKNAAGDTASTLYQTGFSGRAEVGLTGDDDFHFKVSPDGSTFVDALVIDKTSGALAAASDFKFRPSASVTPVSNGDLAFEATSNTSFKIKFKGSDGTVRAATLTLS